MGEPLKPCPFCGGEAKLSQRSDLDGKTYTYSVYCTNGVRNGCGASSGGYLRPEKAIEAWNTRYKRTCNLEEARALVNPDICGDGWDADARRDAIIENIAGLCGAEVVNE